MVESSVSSIGRCHPERYRSTNLNWGICIQFDLLYPSWSADDSPILSSKREKTVNGFAWSPRLPPPCEGIQIRNSWNIFAFGIWNLGNFDRGIRDPGLWNPESTAWNPESRTVLDSLTWGDKAMLSPQMPRDWNLLMILFIWAWQRHWQWRCLSGRY